MSWEERKENIRLWNARYENGTNALSTRTKSQTTMTDFNVDDSVPIGSESTLPSQAGGFEPTGASLLEISPLEEKPLALQKFECIKCNHLYDVLYSCTFCNNSVYNYCCTVADVDGKPFCTAACRDPTSLGSVLIRVLATWRRMSWIMVLLPVQFLILFDFVAVFWASAPDTRA